jgi:two-component system NtrC family response regulator
MKLLLIDDDKNLNNVLAYQLNKNDFEVVSAFDGQSGLKEYEKTKFDVVVADIQMPDITGIDILQEIRKKDKNVIFLIITAYGSVDNALEACKMGADDYLTKPFGIEQLLFLIEKASRLRNLQFENLRLKQELTDRFDFGNMITKSSIMKSVLQMAKQAAESEATILILGESGTGKELLARAIHNNSPRKEKEFIVVNCPSIPTNLIESELFGHVKGSFTGALKDRKGKFELADRGTLFLDEIGDLGLDVQAKLLRVLQEKTFEKLGTSKEIKVDVRIIAATNKNIEEMMQHEKFREDLYYRLSVIPLILPPLRERRDDLPFLIDYFLQKYSKEKNIKIDNDVYDIMEKYSWPGNIRELQNLIERLSILLPKNKITLKDLPSFFFDESNTFEKNQNISLDNLSLEEIEKNAILGALNRTAGNQTKAAKLLDIPRHVLLYRMKKLKISSLRF